MLRLIQSLFEVCLLRRAPQDLPASSAFLVMTFLASLLTGTMLASSTGLSPGLGRAQSLADAAFMLVLLYVALYLLDRLPRFRQSATALLGSSALLGLIAAVPLALLPEGAEGRESGGAALLFLALIAWSILVTGHILRHTFELSLGQGVGVAVLYSFLAYSLLGGIFAGA